MAGLLVLLAMACIVICIARSAYKGDGYRGLYVAIAIVCMAMSYGCFAITPTPRDMLVAVASKDETQIAGTRAMIAFGPTIGGLWLAGAFGGVLGAALFRTRMAGPTPSISPTAVAISHTPPASDPAPPAAPTRSRKFTAVLPGTGRGFFIEVVGESHYQPQLRQLQAIAGTDPVRVLLHPEPENPHDANAVAVKTFEGETLGYLTREDAPRYQQTLLALRERGQTGICSARLVGGDATRPAIGIWLDLEPPTVVAAACDVKYTRVRQSDADPVKASE